MKTESCSSVILFFVSRLPFMYKGKLGSSHLRFLIIPTEGTVTAHK